jgi:hypothetical protein
MLKEALKAKIKGHIAVIRHLKAAKAKVKSSSWEGRIGKMSGIQFSRQRERETGRILHLAHCFSRGTPYEKVEANPSFYPGQKQCIAQAVAKCAGTLDRSIFEWMGIPVEKKTAAQLKAALSA